MRWTRKKGVAMLTKTEKINKTILLKKMELKAKDLRVWYEERKSNVVVRRIIIESIDRLWGEIKKD